MELSVGLFMRYIKGPSSAFLGKPQSAVDVDIYFRRATDPRTPVLNTDIHMELEQLLALKYRGLPHWGKNRPVTFTGVADK